MYDPLETDLSRKELAAIFQESKGLPICLIGGWATYFYVNEEYRRAFGKDYLGSRDIDIFFDPKQEKAFENVIKRRGFEKDGLPFRYEKIYDRENKAFITQEEAGRSQVFNLVYIFLDLFSNARTKLGSWYLEPLRKISFFRMGDFTLADLDTLVSLKCVAIFARDKADKESKDACDLYALIRYGGKAIKMTGLFKRAIEKVLGRTDLMYAIAEHVLLDPGRQGIVEVALRDTLSGQVPEAPVRMKSISILRWAGSFAENKDIAKELRVKHLLPALESKETVTLDFAGVEGATQSFIHALISDLIRSFGPEALDSIIFKNCNETIKKIIGIVAEYMQASG